MNKHNLNVSKKILGLYDKKGLYHYTKNEVSH